MRWRASARVAAIASAEASSRAPSASEAPDRGRVRGHSPESRPDRGGREERRDVADRVAPALVELVGRRRRSSASAAPGDRSD